MLINSDHASLRKKGAGIVVVVIITIMLWIPVLVSLHKLGIVAVFNFFQQDTFYYLAIAQNSTLGFFTYDGELPTNGFHPMWQVCVTLLFKLLGNVGNDAQIYAVFLLSVLLVTLGYSFFGLAIYNYTGSKLLGILIIPGFFHVSFSFVERFGGSVWKYMNGMESCLSLFFGGLLLYVVSRHLNTSSNENADTRWYTVIGVLVGLIIMARLDDVFLVVSLACTVLLLEPGELRKRFRKVVILTLPTLILLTWYLAYNLSSVGVALPISGLEKGGFSLVQNIIELLRVLTPTVFIPGAVNVDLYLTDVYRQILMWFPLIMSILFLFIFFHEPVIRKIMSRGSLYIISLLGYVILKGLYNLFNVHVNHQGLWYYALSVTTIDFMWLMLLSSVYYRIMKTHRHIKILAACLLICFLTFYMALMMKGALWGKPFVYDFYKDRLKIKSTLLSIDPNIKLIEVDDGIFCYFLDIPTIHGMGFALDYPGYVARESGHFLAYCKQRGFDTIASLQYLRFPNYGLSSDRIASILKHSYQFRLEDLDKYIFKVVYIHPESGASFVRFRLKSTTSP